MINKNFFSLLFLLFLLLCCSSYKNHGENIIIGKWLLTEIREDNSLVNLPQCNDKNSLVIAGNKGKLQYKELSFYGESCNKVAGDFYEILFVDTKTKTMTFVRGNDMHDIFLFELRNDYLFLHQKKFKNNKVINSTKIYKKGKNK